jgi:homeobox protein cut-like
MLELLKAFQDEIDRLNKRAKYCEGAFFALYKSIYDAPDPAPLLERLIVSENSKGAQVLEIVKLKKELDEYEEEFLRLKNQEVTIRKLEDQIQDLQATIEGKVTSNRSSPCYVLTHACLQVAEAIERMTTEIREQARAEVSEAVQHQHMLERRLTAAGEALAEAQRAGKSVFKC